MTRTKEFVVLVTLLAVAGAARFIGLGKFTAIDEPFWLRSSGNFYYALGQREFQNTLYEYHPGVTTMWVITAGMLAYFPDFRKLGQGYLKPGKFDAFIVEHGKTMLHLLIVSRAIQVMVLLGLLLLTYLLLRSLFGSPRALFTTGLLSSSPYFLGNSRLLNHEAMLASFSMVALLGMLVYLYVRRKLPVLLVSGVAAGLSQLTKSSGIVLFPVIGLAILVSALGAQNKKIGGVLLDAGRTIGIWLAATAATYVIFWPGMWVAPGRMLSDVYGTALAYTFVGTRFAAVTAVNVGAPPLDALRQGLGIYLTDLAWRNTPLTWLGFLLGIGFAVADLRKGADRRMALATLYATILGALFVLLFSAAQGRKSPHYILTTYVCMDLIAGFGWWRTVNALFARRPQSSPMWLPSGALCGIIALQLVLSLGSYPYYISYYDPVLQALELGGHNPTLDNTGYGVGLDQAAAYLAAKPDAAHLKVMAVNALGSFSYYFPGESFEMNDFVLSSHGAVNTELMTSDYVVADFYNQSRNGTLADLQGVEPEKIIWINGIDFLNIYRAADLRARLPEAQP